MNTSGKIAAAAAASAVGGWLLSRRPRSHVVTEQSPLDDLLDASAAPVARASSSSGPGVGTLAVLAVGGLLLASQVKKWRSQGQGSSMEQSIEVNVPVSTAYNQWTQFEEFPKFMDSVDEVRQLDDQHLHWRATIAGQPKEWDAEITEQIPDKRIAWRSTTGVRNAGVVTFHKISDRKTRVMLQMDYEPENAAEQVGDALGAVRLTARGNLQRFKDMIESRGHESGAWRGSVPMH